MSVCDCRETKSPCVERERERERERGDGRGPVTVGVWPRIRIKGEGRGYHAFYILAFRPLAFCPVFIFWHFVRTPVHAFYTLNVNIQGIIF